MVRYVPIILLFAVIILYHIGRIRQYGHLMDFRRWLTWLSIIAGQVFYGWISFTFYQIIWSPPATLTRPPDWLYYTYLAFAMLSVCLSLFPVVLASLLWHAMDRDEVKKGYKRVLLKIGRFKRVSL